MSKLNSNIVVYLSVIIGSLTIFTESINADNISLLEKELLNCKQLKEDQKRLQCLDIILTKLSKTTAPQFQVQQQQIDKSKPQRSPTTRKNNSGSSEEKTIQKATLVKAYKDKKKRWHFVLDTGEIWLQNEPKYLPKPPSLPAKITISEGIFSSHDLRAEYLTTTVKVHRIN